ncbi:HTH-type transcriptional regulator mlrA [Klebsiella michiganensis]|nr:HTH-type transcriptional regulator mlrA [Klebsiella michiganensis]
MALYTIGEVAQLCDINPVTLRAWQRRYGLLKPQRTDGGHRLFNEYEIDRIREIKRWIDSGVQVGKVKTLLMDNEQEVADGWRKQQEILLGYLQNGSYHRLRMWLKERNHSESAQILVKNLINPLRQRLLSPQPTLLALRGILDGILINHIARTLSSTAKYPGSHALIIGWNVKRYHPAMAGGLDSQRTGLAGGHSRPFAEPAPTGAFPGEYADGLVWRSACSAQVNQMRLWEQQGQIIWLNHATATSPGGGA